MKLSISKGADPNSDPLLRGGVEYLLRTQHEDGSWFVRSRSVKFPALQRIPLWGRPVDFGRSNGQRWH